MSKHQKMIRGFPPIADRNAQILILGSMPSTASLQKRIYYGHPQNQFWKLLSVLLKQDLPESYVGRQRMLLAGRIAVWDVLKTCHRYGSADADITEIQVNDIPGLLKRCPRIGRILLNGRTAERYFLRAFGQTVNVPYRYVPSSSPAHAGVSFRKKVTLWETGYRAGRAAERGRIPSEMLTHRKTGKTK